MTRRLWALAKVDFSTQAACRPPSTRISIASAIDGNLSSVDKRTLYRTIGSTLKSIAVTDLRQRTAEVLEDLRGSDEPYVILQRSQKAAYLVDAKHYDSQMAELRGARRELFLREVREAEAEYAAGGASPYADMEALLAELRG